MLSSIASVTATTTSSYENLFSSGTLNDNTSTGSAFNDGDTQQGASFVWIKAPSGIGSLQFFDDPQYGAERTPTAVTVYSSTANTASTVTGNYTLVGTFALNFVATTGSQNVDSSGLQLNVATLSGLDIATGTQSLLLNFAPSLNTAFNDPNEGVALTEVESFAVPEPSSVHAMLALCFGALGFIIRRRSVKVS